MKKYTRKELEAIRKDMNQGKVYTCIDIYGRGVGNIQISNNYIAWNHYGSSANKNNYEGIKFIVETIFADGTEITPAIYSEYHINYIPADKRYKAIDLSYQHPNVYGL